MDKINQLRNILNKQNCDAYIIPKNDEYFGEYVPKNKDRLKFITGFTGSTGLALILKNKSYLFVDGRYTLQAKKEICKDFKICEIPKIKPYYILKNLNKEITLGFDPKLFTSNTLKNIISNSLIKIKPINNNLIDTIWKNKTKVNNNKFYILEEKYHGESFLNKISKVSKFLKFKDIHYLLTTAVENISWLLNIRGSDGSSSPLTNGKILFNKNGKIIFFTNIKKITPQIKKALGKKVIFIKEELFINYLKKIKNSKILIDKKTCSFYYEKNIHSSNKLIDIEDPIYLLKAIKNKTEISNAKIAHLFDGIALTKFIFWLKNNYRKTKITEVSAQNKLEKYKKQNKNYLYPSFNTISGFGGNGAIVHYRSNNKTNKEIKGNNLYLLDSGSQYFYGTTDVTRTIAIGNLSSFQKKIYSYVLKSHIAVASYKLKKSTLGKHIDKIARVPLLKFGYNYSHGTGHGVGYFLNVHEGPQGLSPFNNHKILPGMILSNEPGFYKENNFGIRIENLIYCKKINNSHSKFINLTMVPIDKDCINNKLFNKNEINWINNYHQKIFYILKPFMNNTELKLLTEACSAIS
ncbi:aminopeptidase P family protein [Candidatus Fonsibacter ubiquis]|uniref:aminopeptidase P family protein n=1 Tax=Candidatus Fonsibacter ubiquis TaxID=1925548 RepID=UPI000C0788A9|nr:aminopeptidase P family protein [Candidatus Fonsibacter ubiquis]